MQVNQAASGGPIPNGKVNQGREEDRGGGVGGRGVIQVLEAEAEAMNSLLITDKKRQIFDGARQRQCLRFFNGPPVVEA